MGFASYRMGGAPDVVVGNYRSLAAGLSVMGERHAIEYMSSSSLQYDNRKPHFAAILSDFGISNWTRAEPPVPAYGPLPVIEHDVWIAPRVTLARGITVATGAVVAFGSIVTRDVAPYTLVAGAPARVVRKRFDDRTIERMLETRWWNFANVFGHCDTREPERFLPSFHAAREAGVLRPVPAVRYGRDDIKLALERA